MDSQTFTYDAAQALNENTFTKPGYTFVEWNTEADGSGTAYADKEEASNLATEGTVNLYAQWEANPFLLIYHSNYNVEGMKETTSQSPQWKTDDYETLKHIESAGFAKLGYTFAGWNTKADGSGKLFTETGSAHKVQFTAADIDENDEAHLYAQWAANTYTVEFNGNGETSGEMLDQTFTYDRAQDLPKNAFAKAGYTFAGWSTVKNGDVVYTGGQEVNNLSAVNGDVITLYAKWTANTYTVKFDGNGATSGTMDDQTFIYDEAKNLTKNAFAKTGYTFAGWSTTEDGSVAYKDGAKVKNLSAVNDDEIILYAQWKADPIEVDIGQYVYKQYVQKYNRADTSGATFTFEAEIDQVTANSGSTAVYAAAPLDLPINLTGTATLSTGETKNVTFTVNGTDSKTVTLDEGLYRIIVKEFDSKNSYIDYDKSEYVLYLEVSDDHTSGLTVEVASVFKDTVPTSDTTVTFVNTYTRAYYSSVTTPSKPTLNTGDHFAYVMGYPDGTVRPNGSITRAEVSTILFRLLSDKTRDEYFTTESSFTDVKAGAWYNNSIATLEKAGVIVDTPKGGAFRPDEAITRAELAAMLAQFADAKPVAGVKFSDVSADHRAYDAIAIAAKMGWIAGYPDGTFRPDATITRAEMMTLVNRALERVPSKEDHLLSERVMLTFPDCKSGDWFYIAVQEAANSHTYERAVTEKNGDEQWTALRVNRDWTLLEK